MRLNPFLPRGEGRGFHYAWVVLASGMVITATSSGVRQAFAVLIDPLVEQYGWSRASISLAYSLLFLASVPLALMGGRLADRYGARKLILASAFLFVAGMLLTATMTQLWQFYLYYGVLLGGVGSTVFNLTLPVLLTHWFHKKAGLALGLLWSAVGTGPIFSAPIFRWLLTTVGWGETFTLVGVVGGGLIFSATLFLRSHPRDVGLRAYGEEAGWGSPQAAEVRVSLGAVRATPAFRYLMLIHNMGCVSHAIPLAHGVSMALRAGVPGMMAAGVLSAISFASLVTRFTVPMLTERLGGRRILSLALLAQSAPILLLLGAREPWSFYTFAILFGLGFGGEMSGFPIINRQYYGAHAPLNTIYSYQMAGAMLGMAFGGWLGGALFDLTGAYTWSILASAIAGFATLLPILLLPAYRPGRLLVAEPTPARV